MFPYRKQRAVRRLGGPRAARPGLSVSGAWTQQGKPPPGKHEKDAAPVLLGPESGEANPGRKLRNSHDSIVFRPRAGSGAVMGISELAQAPAFKLHCQKAVHKSCIYFKIASFPDGRLIFIGKCTPLHGEKAVKITFISLILNDIYIFQVLLLRAAPPALR